MRTGRIQGPVAHHGRGARVEVQLDRGVLVHAEHERVVGQLTLHSG